MSLFFINLLITAVVVSLSAWLSGTRPGLAGFLMAMPLATLLVLPLSHHQYADPVTSVRFAKSIFWAVPVSLFFFVPFLLAGKWHLGFWTCYGVGILLLIAGYFLHQKLTGLI